MVVFNLDMRPKAWERARRSGKCTYKSGKITSIEQYIRMRARCAAGFPRSPWTGPVLLGLELSFRFPKGMSRAERARLDRCPWFDKTPDADNGTKLIADALNGLVYHDDRQIAALVVTKLYRPTDRVRVVLARLSETETPQIAATIQGVVLLGEEGVSNDLLLSNAS